MASLVQRSFAAGEIAPALYARADTVKYATGLRTCRGTWIRKNGGSDSRPGTTWIAEVKDSTKTVRLIPFVFNSSQTYVLEFGDHYMRVHKSGAQLTEAAVTITGITNASPAVVTATGHGYSNGDEVKLSGVLGMTGVNARNFKVAGVTTNTFQLQTMAGTSFDSTALGAYVSGGSAARVFTLATPYAFADLPLLKFIQSADVITLVHQSYPPYELDRLGDTSWTLSAITFGPAISPPTMTDPNPDIVGGTGANQWVYMATSVSPTGEESLPTAAWVYKQDAGSLSTSPITVHFTAAAGAAYSNLYRNDPSTNGLFGFIGKTPNPGFYDTGYTPDLAANPPQSRTLFGSTGNYPATVTYYQQRLVFGNSVNAPETVWTSQSGSFKNFLTSFPTQASDAVTFTAAGRQVNQIQHLVDVGTGLLILTSGGEWVARGDASGILSPSGINMKQYSYYGSAPLTPIVIGGNALYVQARGSIIRDLAYVFASDSYKGNDLTIFSTHLFQGYTIVDWAFQLVQNSIVWVARSDGTLLGLTYVQEQELLAWHRHDLGGGAVENVCCVPEGQEDILYLIVRRQVAGRTVRYLERLSSRLISSIATFTGMDAALSYNGWNTGATTMTLSGGVSWLYSETLTLTASSTTFQASDIGNQFFLTGADGTVIRFTVTGFTSATVVTGNASATVPAGLQNVGTATWARAVSRVTGLYHLEGQAVSVLGDGAVIASPYNPKYAPIVVTSGTITLPKACAVINAGLPYFSDIETLDIDNAQGATIADKGKIVNRLTLFLENSRGGFIGDRPPTNDALNPLENLIEIPPPEPAVYGTTPALSTGKSFINIPAGWNKSGRVFIRQIDPLPLSVLAVVPSGFIPGGQ